MILDCAKLTIKPTMTWREGEREEEAEDSPYGAKDSPYGAPESHRSYIHLHSSAHTDSVNLGRA